MNSRSTTLTELEERLGGAEGDALRGKLARELSQLELRLVMRLAGMVPKSEYVPLSACVEAARAAQTVLRDWVIGTAHSSVRSQ